MIVDDLLMSIEQEISEEVERRFLDVPITVFTIPEICKLLTRHLDNHQQELDELGVDREKLNLFLSDKLDVYLMLDDEAEGFLEEMRNGSCDADVV